jgi:hypothetical protein
MTMELQLQHGSADLLRGRVRRAAAMSVLALALVAQGIVLAGGLWVLVRLVRWIID